MRRMSGSPWFRGAGVLLHPTSLPGPHGIGDLGAGARAFIDWLESARMALWQVLPLVPPGGGDSPYSSTSAFAASPWLIDLSGLREAGLLSDAEVAGALPAGDIDFGAVHAFKAPRLQLAADRVPRVDGERFRVEQPWVEDAALFSAIRERLGGAAWWTWPRGLRTREPGALDEARRQLSREVDRAVAVQLLFDRQWRTLRAYAAARGVRIIGDMPIYVDADSADAWANPERFVLDAEGGRPVVAGVPPDAFSDTGQLWGNPLYRWERLQEEGFGWWIARVRRALELTDYVRIDHFRAFSAYWEVPGDAPDARGGRWVDGPGAALFDAFKAALGTLPILAEDLGLIDAPVRELLAHTGFPGMKVLQFAFGGDARNLYLPHNHTKGSVVYTGTHDNDTTAGWWASASSGARDHVQRYFGADGRDPVWTFIRAAFASVSDFAIVPMQDVLELGSEARMNKPAVAGGNWRWRMAWADLRSERAARLRELAIVYGRV